MSEWERIGTVEILRLRIYPLDPNVSPQPLLSTNVAVEPGIYPVYRKFDAICWVMTGRINERHAKIGDGLFEMNPGDSPTGVEVQFPSPTFGVEEFRKFLNEPTCQPGEDQRLKFRVEVAA